MRAIPSMFDHLVRNSSTRESNYQQRKEGMSSVIGNLVFGRLSATRRLCPNANQGNLPSSECAGEQQAFHCPARDLISRPAPNFPPHGLTFTNPDRIHSHRPSLA